MTCYYSKYIQDYSKKSKILYDKVNEFDDWTSEEIQAFNLLKTEISKAVLYLPTPHDELVLRTDASNDTVSAILETNRKQPIYFCSRKLSLSEKRSDIVEKEALAIYWGIKRLKSFLLGRRFTVLSDHKPLQFIFNNEKCGPKVLRWKLQLQEFDFEVRHCSGRDNVVADSFTRINALLSDSLPLITEDEVIKAQHFDKEATSINEFINGQLQSKPDTVTSKLWEIRNHLKVENNILLHEMVRYLFHTPRD